MISPPPAAPPAASPNGRTAAPPAPTSRTTRLQHAGYWTRWIIGLVALLALLDALGALVLYLTGVVPVALLVYVLGLSLLLALAAVVVSPPLYAPPSTARLEAEDWLRNRG